MKNDSTSKRSFFKFFPFLFAGILASNVSKVGGETMFKGSNINFQNPIFFPNKSRKLKGYQRSLATRSFNKNR